MRGDRRPSRPVSPPNRRQPGGVDGDVLPSELAECVDRCVRASGLRGATRAAVSRELVGHMHDALEAGRPVVQIVAEFGDPELAGALIGRSRRAHPLRRRVLAAIASLGAAAAASLYVSSAVSLHSGAPELRATSADPDEVRGLADRPVDIDGLTRLVDRLVARMYTDDGSGSGELTAEGLRIVQRLKGVERPSILALVVEPLYFALPAPRRDVEREAHRAIRLAERARGGGRNSGEWRAFERDVDRFAWSNRDAYRFVPLAIVLPRLRVALEREAVRPRPIARGIDGDDLSPLR